MFHPNNGAPHALTTMAGLMFAMAVDLDSFREYLAELGAPEPCPVIAYCPCQEDEKQKIVDMAFAKIQAEGDEDNQILLVRVDKDERFGLKIERVTFEEQVCSLQREAEKLLQQQGF